MKTLLFILLFSASAFAQTQQDSVYYIQIMSTQNPELVRAEHLSMSTLDTAYYEKAGKYYRILIKYETFEEAWFMEQTWKRSHKTAFITARSKKESVNIKPFYTYETN